LHGSDSTRLIDVGQNRFGFLIFYYSLRVHWQQPGENIRRLTKASEASFGFMPTFIYR
jgi:hypothetical protein